MSNVLMEIVARQIGRKTTCVLNAEKGAAWFDVPDKMHNVACISDEEAIEIATIAKSVETKLGCPQDTEWAIDSDLPFPKNIFWLQTRPAKIQAATPMSVTDQILNMIAKRF